MSNPYMDLLNAALRYVEFADELKESKVSHYSIESVEFRKLEKATKEIRSRLCIPSQMR